MADEPVRQLTGPPAAYERLDAGQLDAVDSEVDTVVLAGPGSGKTDTLAIKAAIELQRVPPPRGVACITFTRAAAREIRARVDGLGVKPGRRLVASTLHSFCLRHIIRPFAALVGEPELAQREVIAHNAARAELKRANEDADAWVSDTNLQVMRRTAAIDEDMSALFPTQAIRAMERYEERLATAGLIDYDGMVHEALRLVQTYPVIVDLCAARFQWLFVDEYQDLGGPLHYIVQTLRASRQITVFAVGDPDQTILQFTGADARFLESLENDGFHAVRLRFNYRCGARIVRASSGALTTPRDYEPDPSRSDEGEVLSVAVEGGLAAQARSAVTEIVPRFRAAGWPAHEIAVLYPGKGWLMERIVGELETHEVPYSLERDPRFSQLGDIVGWLQRCAQWSIDAWAEQQGRFRDLADDLREYLADAGHPAARTSLAAAEFLYPRLETPVDPDELLADWLARFLRDLDLDEILARGEIHAQEREALADLVHVVRYRHPGLLVQAFAGPVRRPGRLVVTTYHSAKGRQFDAVILPGLQDGVMPRARKQQGRWKLASVDHDRNLFYVALTRARHSVALLWSESSEDAYGDPADWRRSRFVDDVLTLV